MSDHESNPGPVADDRYERTCPVCSATHACSHHLVTFDATFPGEYVEGVFEWEQLYAVFEGLYGFLNAVIAAGAVRSMSELQTYVERTRDLPPRLDAPLFDLMENTAWELDDLDPDTEIEGDAYFVNHQADAYLASVFTAGGRHGYVGSTRHEDCVPMASSAYSNHWARDADACGASARVLFKKDLELLRRLAENVR